MINIPAFELLRKFKEVLPETERLVLKKVRNVVTTDELAKIFEKGIAGEYGKFIAADPQTLLSWVSKHNAAKNSSQNYLSAGLLPVNAKMSHPDYPLTPLDWQKEVNKCYRAFCNGVFYDNFHPLVYTQMQMDDYIRLNEYLEYTQSGNLDQIHLAQQKAVGKKFSQFKEQGKQYVYYISNN